MKSDSRRSGIHCLVQNHRRLLISVYLCVGIGALLLFPVDKLRTAILYRVEEAISYWDDRWTRRVEYGDRLVASQKFATAIAYLERLDRDFPAQSVKHKRDVEREQILRNLGHSYTQISQKRNAIAVYRRLVAFDPRNFANHYDLAIAYEHFGDTSQASNHFKNVLTIYPTHLPSIHYLLKYYFDSANYNSVVTTYERYLDAFLLQKIAVTFRDLTVTAEVPVDGYFHNTELKIYQEQEWSGQLSMTTGGFSVEVQEVTLQSPVFVGVTSTSSDRVWSAKDGWYVNQMDEIRTDVFRPRGPKSVLCFDVPSQHKGVSLVRLRLRLLKPLDVDSWAMVEASYRNLLMIERLHAAQDRSIIRDYALSGQ